MTTPTTGRRYGVWAGNPKGYAEDVTRCVAAVGGGTMWGPAHEHQCYRKRVEGEYCKQHAPKATPEAK